jgi:cyanophycinase-like exopeptidase
VQTLPGTIGIGIDEDTALIVGHDGIGEVVGYSHVYFFRQRGRRLEQYALVEGQRFDLVRFCAEDTPPTL